jgi:hypothetical protein
MARSRSRFDDAPAKPKPKSDAYVGLLLISFLALIIGCVFLYLDYAEYGQSKPPKLQIPQAGATQPPGVPGAPPPPAPEGGAPMGGGAAPMGEGAPPMGGGAPPMGGGAPAPMGGAGAGAGGINPGGSF